MTLSASDLAKARDSLSPMDRVKEPALKYPQSRPAQTSLTMDELIKRLGNLLTPEEADELERNINESCEQEND